MEMVPALFDGATQAAGATAGTAATGGWTTTIVPETGTSTTLSALQGQLTAGQMLMKSIASGVQVGQGVGNMALSFSQAESERLAGEQKANQIKRELVQAVGKNRVAFAGSGTTIDSGDAIEAGLRSQAQHQTEIEKANARIKQFAAVGRGLMSGLGAAASLKSGMVQQDVLKTGLEIDLARRG